MKHVFDENGITYLWGANRTRGFKERQSPTIRTAPLAAG